MISEISSTQRAFLDSFAKEVDLTFERSDERLQWSDRIKNILKDQEIFFKTPIDRKAYEIQEKFNHPSIPGERTNLLAQKTLRREMKAMLERESEKLGALQSFEEMVNSIPKEELGSFLEAFHCYSSAHLAEGEEKAFSKGLAYALSRTFIESGEFEDNSELEPYICPIRKDLVELDPVYLEGSQLNEEGVPLHIYHASDLSKWVYQKGTDPINRKKRTLGDIRPYPAAKKRVKEILDPLKYPRELNQNASPLRLPHRSFILAACLGFPSAKNIYQEVKNETEDYVRASKAAEKFELFAIDLFQPFLKQVPENDLFLFDWTLGTLKRKNGNQGYTRSVPVFNEEETEIKIEFMLEFLNVHKNSEASLEELQSLLENQMNRYLELSLLSDSLEIGFFERSNLQLKIRNKILEGEEISQNEFKLLCREAQGMSETTPVEKIQQFFR